MNSAFFFCIFLVKNVCNFSVVELLDSRMEKAKERAFSPDTVLEDFLRSAESQSDSSRASTSESLVEIDPNPFSRLAGFFGLLRFKSRQQVPTFPPLNSLKLSKKFSSSLREQVTSPLLDPNSNYFKPQWKNFTLSELQTATSNFCQGLLTIQMLEFARIDLFLLKCSVVFGVIVYRLSDWEGRLC